MPSTLGKNVRDTRDKSKGFALISARRLGVGGLIWIKYLLCFNTDHLVLSRKGRSTEETTNESTQ